MPSKTSSVESVSSAEQTPLHQLRAQVQQNMEKVNALIFQQIENEIDLIPDLSNHTIASGGKRLRPMLTLASAMLCGYEGEEHIALATSVEFMHTATLLHDDVVDGSELRRNRETANHIWGNKSSILVGDYLLGKAFNLMVRPQSVRVLEVLSHAAMVISEGEILQLAAEGTLPEDDANYRKIINAKTAALFSAACEVGAIIAGVEQHKIEALRHYGLYLGNAFQIADDALDYTAMQEKIGKHIGDDFRDRKATLPLILAYMQATDEEKAFWQRTIVENQQTEQDCQQAIAYMNKYDAVGKSFEAATVEAKKAAACLDVFEDSLLKRILVDVAFFSANRDI